MNNGRKTMNANSQKTENNASPSPAPVIRQSAYQVMADKAGVDREAVAVDIRKYIASNPEADKWPKDAIFSLAITVHKLGLSLAPAMGEAFIMPSRTGCELVIGYRGLLKLARKSGRVRGADAQVVRATDEFKLKLAGESYDVEWSADVSGLEEPGAIVGAFARVFMADAPTIVTVLRMDSVLALRERKGPMWQREPEQMVRKTALARALRLVPGLDEKLGELAGEGDDA